MKALPRVALPLLFLPISVFSSQANKVELPLRSTVETSAEPLSTEKVWSLDPSEWNPHRQRWILERDVQLLGLNVTRKGPSRFGVEARELRSAAKLHFRGPGPWYRPLKEFSCEQEPNARFATEEGSRRAGQSAASSWENVMSDRKLRLVLLLERLSGPSAELVLAQARLIFKEWLSEAELEWQVKSRSQSRVAEWRYYLTESATAGICKPRGTVAEKSSQDSRELTWKEIMEPPGESEAQNKLLVRAPARRWNGLYTVRLSVGFGDKTLNGQFLLDSGSAVSTVSPTWLQAQGINPALVMRPGLPSQRVTWSGGSGIARKALAFQVSMAGFPIALNEFLLMDTDLFGPPEHVSSCCDGILGLDFLRQFSVEFLPGPPAAVKIWAPEGFSLGTKTPWVEIATTPRGELLSSSCILSSSKKAVQLVGVRWDTGSEMSIEVHTPWSQQAKRGKSPWEMQCGDVVVATDAPVSYPNESDEHIGSPLRARMPAVNVGAELLGRGSVSLDMPHGRLWFSKENLSAPVMGNKSGLDLEFVYNKYGERELKVIKILPKSPAASLAQVGLKPGMQVTKIDTKEALEMDIWEVEQRLAGVFSSTIQIEWKTKDSLKLAPLTVRQP
jgi:hypothetical protein